MRVGTKLCLTTRLYGSGEPPGVDKTSGWAVQGHSCRIQVQSPPELVGRARRQHAHREDGGDLVEGRDEDPDLADAGGQEQGPRWLSVGFAVAEDLRTQQPSRLVLWGKARDLTDFLGLHQSWGPMQ